MSSLFAKIVVVIIQMKKMDHNQRGSQYLLALNQIFCDPTNINSYVYRSGNISKLKKYFYESKITKNCNAFLTETKQLNNKPKILVIGSGKEDQVPISFGG